MHIAATADVSSGASGIKLYVDGIEQTADSTSGSETAIYDGNAAFEIGATNGTAAFDGHMSDVRLWNDVRTEEEIRENMYINVASDASGLVSNWLLNNDFTDEHANGNDMTAHLFGHFRKGMQQTALILG